MKMKWRRRLLLVGSNKQQDALKGGPEAEVIKKEVSDGKSVSSKGLLVKESGQKGVPRKPKWSMSRPPPVQTSYNDEVDDMPRISNQLTTKELQHEALARGIERKYLPSSRADLLNFLVDGSIYLKKTKAWKDVERLKSKMEADCRRIEEEKSKLDCANTASESHSNSSSDKAGSGILDGDLLDPATFSRDPSQMSSIQSTIPSQQVSHRRQDSRHTFLGRDLSFATQTEETSMGQLMRFVTVGCVVPTCSARVSTNDHEVNKTGSDRRKEKELAEVFERRTHMKEGRKQESIEHQQKNVKKWDESVQFEPWIISPPKNNQKPSGNSLKGYTVWCSISSDVPDSPPKQFDATYKGLGDANDRARYLFYWRNPWRLSPVKMVEFVLVKSDNSENNDCTSTFHCVHPNGDKWIVSVVHDSTFKYLDNASTSRHDLDQEE